VGLRGEIGQVRGRCGGLEGVVAAVVAAAVAAIGFAAVAAVVAAGVGRPATPARTEAASTVRGGLGQCRDGESKVIEDTSDSVDRKLRRKAAG
jgi:hypothetical protein